MRDPIGSGRCRKSASLKQLITWHIKHKRSVAVQDIYKMLYQAVFGPQHIITDVEGARAFLREEFRRLAASREEPLVEEISVSGSVIRVNLRPYKFLNGDVDLLFSVMRASSQQTSASHGDFIELWGQFVELVKNQELSFNMPEIQHFSQQLREKGPCPVHHSRLYWQENAPAYRVVSADLFVEAEGGRVG